MNNVVAGTFEELEPVVSSVFSTMMGIAVESLPPETQWSPPPGTITAAVYLTGEWRGAVFLHCDPEHARAFTGRFLSMDPPGEVDNDVRDVMGELANMIGGNLKCVMCPGIRLSAPSVVDGADCGVRVCGAHRVHLARFDSECGPFRVAIWQANEPTLCASSPRSR